MSVPSLHRESTDSLICLLMVHVYTLHERIGSRQAIPIYYKDGRGHCRAAKTFLPGFHPLTPTVHTL